MSPRTCARPRRTWSSSPATDVREPGCATERNVLDGELEPGQPDLAPLYVKVRGLAAFKAAPALVAVAEGCGCRGRVGVRTGLEREYRRFCRSGKWLIRSVDVRGQVDRAGFLSRPVLPSRARLRMRIEIT